MDEPVPSIPVPDEVLDAIAERVAEIVIERLGDELRLSLHLPDRSELINPMSSDPVIEVNGFEPDLSAIL